MANFDGRVYQARIDALAATGCDVHGEATLVRSYAPRSTLDAGCGTGRVAIELARHGIEVVGVDRASSMIAEAARLAPELTWIEADLATLDLGRTFDCVVLAGNVPLFCPPAARTALVSSCAAHVAAAGMMIAGFQLDGQYELADYDAACASAGLQLAYRWSTWGRDDFVDGGKYAVSLHRR